MSPELLVTVGVILAVLVAASVGLFVGIHFKLWLRAYVSGTGIGLVSLILMSLRKVDARAIVEAKIMAVQAGLTQIATSDLEAHYLAGGDVRQVIRALIAAHRARIELDWNTGAAIDLAGRDVLDAVQMSVNPRVIDCPDPRKMKTTALAAVAKNGVQLKVRARVTVRANLAQLVGGATEETVVARVGEGIISAIGSCGSHEDALAHPAVMTQRVLDKGLDAQTAFAIVSIDIASVEVGENVGARLQTDQAEADKRVARAKAEQRRARATAVEQEMRALTVENRAEVVLNEAEIPKAQADAFRDGNLGTKRNHIVLSKDRGPYLPVTGLRRQ